MDALIVLILVLRGEANDPTTVGAVRATYELLGTRVEVKVRELESLPSDEQALELGRGSHAYAIVELGWEAPAHRLVRVHFHFESRPGWNDRTIAFSASDDPAERGRTIGFALASMLPAPTSTPGPPRTLPRVVERGGEVPSDSDGRDARQLAVQSARGSNRVWLGSVDVLGSTSMGVRGQAEGWGGAVSARWYFSYPVGARIGASARAGEIDPAQATSLQLHLAAGVVWLPVTATAGQPFELGGRLDALAIRDRITHFSSDDPVPVPQARWLPGVDVALEGSWFFNPTAALVGALAMEAAFGSTEVTIHHQRVATIPPLRVVVQAGVRASF